MVMLLLQSLYFMLPAYLANLAPPLAKKFNLCYSLAKPVDFNKTFKGQPLFGRTKTWRGFVIGILVGILVVIGQKFALANSFFAEISLIDYLQINVFLLGILMGGGALIGDLVNSFIKRRLNKPSGSPWIPFDQMNFVVGALFFVSFINIPPWSVIITILIVSFFLHILFNRLGYYLRIQKTKW